MKTEAELNTDILKITMMIREKYPELLKHLIEMPIKKPEAVRSDVAVKGLKDYYDTLETLVGKYAETHKTT
ncbi:MAG TPA: hypothetical protein VK835_12295 [Bacteroidia bacterium]|jgi:hypothetical protein|nr:hypothetical protein [Bacteroidia bacterium]